MAVYPARYIDPINGNDTTGDGSSALPWKTIQKAVNTIDIGVHTEIKLRTGTYTEPANGHLWISRAIDASIFPDTDHSPVIANSDANYCVFMSSGAGAANVELLNLTLSPAGATGVGTAYVTTSTGTMAVRNCTITAPGNGVRFGAGTMIVEDCTIQAGGTAAVMMTGANCVSATVTGNTITCPATSRGVYIPDYVPAFTVEDNTITHSGATANTGIELGVDGTSNPNPIGTGTCQGNRVLFTGAGHSHGITLGKGCDDCECSDNFILNADIAAVIKGDGNYVHHNRASAERGVLVLGGARNIVVFNSIYQKGIYTEIGGIHWGNSNGAYTDPSQNVFMFNVVDASGGVGAALCNDEPTATNEGHFDNVCNFNIYVPGTAGHLARLDGNVLDTDSGDDLDDVRTIWQGTWTNGGDCHVTANDSQSVLLAASIFADPDNDDFRLMGDLSALPSPRPGASQPADAGGTGLFMVGF